MIAFYDALDQLATGRCSHKNKHGRRWAGFRLTSIRMLDRYRFQAILSMDFHHLCLGKDLDHFILIYLVDQVMGHPFGQRLPLDGQCHL